MDIRALDETALADDVVMCDFYDIARRAELLGRPHAPFWELREFLGAFRSTDSGERQDLFAAYDGDRMVGNAVLWSFLLTPTSPVPASAWTCPSGVADLAGMQRWFAAQVSLDITARLGVAGGRLTCGRTRCPEPEQAPPPPGIETGC